MNQIFVLSLHNHIRTLKTSMQHRSVHENCINLLQFYLALDDLHEHRVSKVFCKSKATYSEELLQPKLPFLIV